MLIQAPRGTRDILPKDSGKWQFVESVIREVTARHGLREVRTPVFEHTELFLRGVGDTTDIVQKEMYTFLDKGERSITLKPEGTAGVVRAYIEHGLFNDPQPIGMFYLYSPVFRYEAPQAGRLREHHQWGVEFFGAALATLDAEVIAIAGEVIDRIGIQNVSLHINSIGCSVCRPAYQSELRAHFAPNLSAMCDDCKRRYDHNPLRLLDCKDARCQPFKKDAPFISDCLCDECATHFVELRNALSALKIPFIVDPGIVRGLDYYTRTVFEFIVPLGDSMVTLTGGGRYDGLVEQLGGPAVSGIGFGSGMERLLMVAEEQCVDLASPSLFDVMVVSLGEDARREAFSLADDLRAAGLSAGCDHIGRSLKAQFKYADKLVVPYCVILAPDELSIGAVKLRDMFDGSETTLSRTEIVRALVDAVKNRRGKK